MLVQLAVALLFVLLHPFHVAPSSEARAIGTAMAEAVALDTQEPITGTKAGDLALGLEFALRESSLRLTKKKECVVGDSGLAFGPWQLQNTPSPLACAAATAARLWLVLAHDSMRRCKSLPFDDRLAGVTSGNCDHGRVESRQRMIAARASLATVTGDQPLAERDP